MRIAHVFKYAAILTLLALFASSAVLFAGNTGKLRGKLINSKTKEPLPFGVVQIDGTTMGAQADANGEYIIINVPPGTYNVTAKLQGYQSVKTENVEILVDRTTTVNFSLQESVVEMETQIVEAPRDLLKVDQSNNVRQITAENIKNMPVTNVQELMKTQVGVVERFGEIHIRGGRANEVTYVVDGVPIKDPLGGAGSVDQAMNISGNVIEDLQIIKGGFDAEYGNAASGIVNITTKSGTDYTTGNLEYLTDDLGTDILNKNSFNYDRLEYNMSGPDPVVGNKILPRLGINWFSDKVFYQLQGAADKTDDYVSYKDYFTSASATPFRSRSILGLFDVADRMKNEYEAQFRMRLQASANIRLNFQYRGSWTDATAFDWNFIYTPATAYVNHDRSSVYKAQLTHQIDKSTYYEVTLSRFLRSYLSEPGDPNTPGGGLTPDQFTFFENYERYNDLNHNGHFDAPEPFVNANGDTSWLNGGPFYTFGDAFIPGAYNDGSGNLVYVPGVVDEWNTATGQWPLNAYEDFPEFRGVNVKFQGQGNSSGTDQNSVDTILTDWNGNGVVDFYESEQFADLNGDGHWNSGDYLIHDTNGNGVYDPSLGVDYNVDQPEPYVDGDVSLGEPFTDVNGNGVYDKGIDIFILSADPARNQDLNHSSKYEGPDAPWQPGTPFIDLNGNGIYDAPNGVYDYGEPFTDLNKNGKWDPADGFWDRGHDQYAVYHDRSTVDWRADFKVTKQFSKEHNVKTGMSLDLYDIKYAELEYPQFRYDGAPDGGPWPDRGVFRFFYHHRPTQGAIFVQDQMTYGAMIANLGLRYDFFIQSADLKTSQTLQTVTGSVVGSQNRFSPRIGFSYPISDVAKVFFNYGHFNQLPELSVMYQPDTQASNAARIVGNPNLNFSKTIEYEFGVRYKLSDAYVLSASGFYKDIFGIINTQREGSGPTAANVYQNSDYARARGLEFELDKDYGNYIRGQFTYSYSFAYGKSSSANSNYFDDFYNRAIPIQEFPLSWDVRHQITLNLDFTVPQGNNPKLFGFTLPDNWGANVIWQFGSGYPYTPASDYPGLVLEPGEVPQSNSLRYPSTSNVDINAWKRIPFLGLDYQLRLWINNLFNTKNVDYIYGLTGRYDTNTKSPGTNWVFAGTDNQRNPTDLGPGRNIRLGISLEF